MPMAYNPGSASPAIESIEYVVGTTGDRFFIPTTGQGDNANAGTTAQQLAQCKILSPLGVEKVAS